MHIAVLNCSYLVPLIVSLAQGVALAGQGVLDLRPAK